MRVLGLDLQCTRLGWACLTVADGVETIEGGVLRLGMRTEPGKRLGTTRQVEVPELRFYDLRHKLDELLLRLDEAAPLDVVAYELVGFVRGGRIAAHQWGAAQASLVEVVYRYGLAYRPIELRTVAVSAGKLALGGAGNASVETMLAAARKRWPGARVEWTAGDCDALDAVGVALAVIAPGETKAARAKREAVERRAARGAT